jgi:transaldolase
MNKLEQLRQMTDVVADTGDIEAIAKYKPVDATTNPSLLLKAAALPQYSDLIDDTVAAVKADNVADKDLIDELADRYAVAIGCEILKIVPGRISTEVDARLSFDREASVVRAQKLIDFYDSKGIGRERVLIKLASTWEGIEAARQLESEGINCNLTLLFCDIQAVAAAKAGAFLISPFVGRILDWYKKAESVDSYAPNEDPGVLSVRNIYQLFKTRGFTTIVMGASFRNVGEIEALAGCDRLTIAPNFLQELEDDNGELRRVLEPKQTLDFVDCDFADEADFRLQLNASAMATEKLAEGIRGFIADQIKLEDLLRQRIASRD